MGSIVHCLKPVYFLLRNKMKDTAACHVPIAYRTYYSLANTQPGEKHITEKS